MKPLSLLPGISVDVKHHLGSPHVAFHDNVTHVLRVHQCAVNLASSLEIDSIPMPEGNAAARLDSDGVTMRIAYRTSEGKKDFGFLKRYDNNTTKALDLVYGSRPFAFGRGELAVQRGDISVDVYRVSDGFLLRQIILAGNSPTGLSHIDAEGIVWTWEEMRQHHSWGAGWTSDGLAEFAEGHQNGVVGQLLGQSGFFAVWTGQQVHDPRTSMHGTEIVVGVRTDNGPIQLVELTAADLVASLPGMVPSPPTPQVVKVTPINREMHFMYYFDYSDRYGDNPNAGGNVSGCFDAGGITRALAVGQRRVIIGTHASVFDTSYLVAEIGAAKTKWNKVVAINVAEEGSAALMKKKVDAAIKVMTTLGLPRRPIFSYSARKFWNVAGVDWVGVECYADPSETDAELQKRLDAALAVVPTGQTVVLVFMAYDRNGQFTDRARLSQLQGRWSAIAAKTKRAICSAMFSDGRPGGVRDYKELRPVHARIFDTITGAPPIVTVGTSTPVGPLALTISSYKPATGKAPLEVDAVAVVTNGTFVKFRWRHRLKGQTVWINASSVSVKLNHTFTFTQKGTYQIGLEGEDITGRKAATGKERLVVVT